MNWDYVAGLFDGDGYGNICFRHHKGRRFVNWSVHPQISIAVSGETKKHLIKFLNSYNIKCGEQKRQNSLGSCESIRVSSWGGVEIFVNNMSSKCYIKRKQVLLLKKAVDLHKQIKNDPEKRILHHLREFDHIRHEIHSYTRKGRKKLKEYDFPTNLF